MDHRVKPGGDAAPGRYRMQSGRRGGIAIGRF